MTSLRGWRPGRPLGDLPSEHWCCSLNMGSSGKDLVKDSTPEHTHIGGCQITKPSVDAVKLLQPNVHPVTILRWCRRYTMPRWCELEKSLCWRTAREAFACDEKKGITCMSQSADRLSIGVLTSMGSCLCVIVFDVEILLSEIWS